MPERKRTRRIDTEALQGEGSYVVMGRVLVRDIKEMRGKADESPDMLAVDINAELLSRNLIRWNWVDDEGEPLPQPFSNIDVFDLLSDEEFKFLAEELMGTNARKN